MKNKMEIKRKMEIKNLVLILTVLLCSVATIVIGQTEPNSVTAVSADKVLPEQKPLAEVNKPAEELTDKAVTDMNAVQSINFSKDMSIRDALSFLAAKYHKNIIPSSKVNGRLNVTRLYGVTFGQALSAILGDDFKYETKGNFIKVYSADEYKKIKQDASRMTSKVFTLYYVNAAEVKALITPALSSKGKLSTTTPAAVDTEAGTGGDTLSMRDMVTVYDFPERIEKIGKLIKQIDVRPPQIMIEVTILDATLTETTNFGINWDKIAGLRTTSTVSTPLGISANLSNSAATAFTTTLSNSAITLAISAQEDISSITVLANPKIMALNKQAGYLNIGEENGYTKSTTQNATGTTTSTDFLESGTILRFRPYICNNGYIRMEINPELSTQTLNLTTQLPDKTITTVKTNIMVKNGKTIIIGGLFKEDMTNTGKQVPIVGDLPIIGALFKSTSDKNIRHELVVLITPHIINEPEDTHAEARKEDIDRIVHGSRKQISSLSRVRFYEDEYSKAVKLYDEGRYDEALDKLNWIIAFRPSALEANQLRDKILSETAPQKYKTSQRKELDDMSKKLDDGWIRR